MKECKSGMLLKPLSYSYNPYTRVVREKEENVPVKYLLQSSELYYDLSPKEVWEFKHKCMKHMNLEYPGHGGNQEWNIQEFWMKKEQIVTVKYLLESLELYYSLRVCI